MARARPADTGKSHGSALGDDEIAATKELLGFDPEKTFEVDRRRCCPHAREVEKRGKAAHKTWDKRYAAWREAQPERAALLDRLVDGTLPDGLREGPARLPGRPKGLATRAASGKVLGALADVLPELWGGSADLAESNNTTMAGEPSFIPTGKQTHEWKGGPYGRTLHFGIRENAMGMILNGIALEGLTRPYGGTFLVFSDYMRPAVRLAADPAAPGDLRVDARLDRPRRGRPDPPADRAPRRAAGHARAGRRAPGRRQRDRGRVGAPS